MRPTHHDGFDVLVAEYFVFGQIRRHPDAGALSDRGVGLDLAFQFDGRQVVAAVTNGVLKAIDERVVARRIGPEGASARGPAA